MLDTVSTSCGWELPPSTTIFRTMMTDIHGVCLKRVEVPREVLSVEVAIRLGPTAADMTCVSRFVREEECCQRGEEG